MNRIRKFFCSPVIQPTEEVAEAVPALTYLFEERLYFWSGEDWSWLPRNVKIPDGKKVLVICNGTKNLKLDLNTYDVSKSIIGQSARRKCGLFPDSLPVNCTSETNVAIGVNSKLPIYLNLKNPEIVLRFVKAMRIMYPTELDGWYPEIGGVPVVEEPPQPNLVPINVQEFDEIEAPNEGERAVEVQPVNEEQDGNATVPRRNQRRSRSKKGGVTKVE